MIVFIDITSMLFYFYSKNRIVKDPKFEDLCKLRIDLERQEENMLVLRHPYLTKEQSCGHMKDLKVPINFKHMNQEERNVLFKKHWTWEQQLGHLRVKDCWE